MILRVHTSPEGCRSISVSHRFPCQPITQFNPHSPRPTHDGFVLAACWRRAVWVCGHPDCEPPVRKQLFARTNLDDLDLRFPSLYSGLPTLLHATFSAILKTAISVALKTGESPQHNEESISYVMLTGCYQACYRMLLFAPAVASRAPGRRRPPTPFGSPQRAIEAT